MNQKRIEGAVVLYQPDAAVVDSIRSYIDGVERLYVIDNSAHTDANIIQQITALGKCQYIQSGYNQGIATALNTAARLAIGNGAHWLLTMDQDSVFEPGAFSQLAQFALAQDEQQVGIVSPFHQTNISVTPQAPAEEVLTTMTSGNLVNLAAYQSIAGFDEDYFIDAVDWDFCLRLNQSGYKVLRLNTAVLKHNLGNATQHSSPSGKKAVALNYNKIRRYYITRNKLMILARYRRQYPAFCRQIYNSLKMDLKYIVLYEDKKAGKLMYMLKGLMHYLLGQKGALKR